MASNTYSFLDVDASIIGPGGGFTLKGGNSEEGITVSRPDDKNTMSVGADGQVMHSLHAGKPGLATVRLLKTSAINLQLSALYNLQTSSSTLHGQNTIVVRDNARGDIITCQQCAFKRHPDIKYAKAGDMNEWTFDVGIVDGFLGAG
jgi:hypothetical protein